MMLFPFVAWFRKHYAGKYKFARTMFGVDMMLLGVALTLAVVALVTWMHPSTRFEDNIVFEATVAPREIVSGASSTLVIRYTNGTNEDLRDARLRLTFPAHFLLQGITIDETNLFSNEIDLGTIAIGATGAVHVRGVMFGDVGGEQKFQSTLTFVHGTQKNLAGEKISDHVFSPERSTLALSLKLPEQLLAFQDVEGMIVYENTGEFALPVITIDPEWPEGFVTSSKQFNVPVVKTPLAQFDIPAVEPGEKGEIKFKGYLGDVGDELTWIFHPSFTFGEDRYKQETLTQVTSVVSAPIKISHSVEQTSLQPGASARFRIEYENISDFAISDLVLGIESSSPFFTKDEFLSTKSIKEIKPGERGSVDLQVPLRSTIRQSETTMYENLTVTTRSIARYMMGEDAKQRVTSKGTSIESPITTPLVLESFARYFTASGDQIGRGPLPPRINRPTSMWIFWSVNGTTNAIENVRIEGTVPVNVEFTGRESSSQNSGVRYDEQTRKIYWTTEKLTPTLSPTSKIVGVAFEVEVTPEPTQVATFPTILKNITFTATDSTTGALLTRTGKDITTSLPNDDFAKENGLVH